MASYRVREMSSGMRISPLNFYVYFKDFIPTDTLSVVHLVVNFCVFIDMKLSNRVQVAGLRNMRSFCNASYH